MSFQLTRDYAEAKAFKREKEIAEIAYRIWLEEGKPDGETLVVSYLGKSWGKKIPLRVLHWEKAINEWVYGPDYFRSW